MAVLLVAIGGVVGVLTRYALATTVSQDTLPWVTAGINVAGSFLLGLLTNLGGGLAPEIPSHALLRDVHRRAADRPLPSASWAVSRRSRRSRSTF